MPQSNVTLIGAGPGDPELLTIKAVKALRAATVVLVDDLVSEACLAYVKRSARIVRVGKRAGCASTPQAFIEQLMIREALAGERVVRLKGGDPFVFGRGGEELEHLRAEGVQVQVINGITAGLAASTALQVPLTHRDHAHGVIFVTGHAKNQDAQIDWAQLAATAAQGFTLVIYMGLGQSESLQRSLLQALPAHTPAAIIQNTTLPSQKHALCTLATLRETIEREQLASPSIIIVGDVLKGAAAALLENVAPQFGT